MPNNISPGVYTKIIDLSEYVASIPGTTGFIPILCEKGPDNELIRTNSIDFYKMFGEPNINYLGKAFGSGPYVADSFLRESDSLYVIRCLPEELGEGITSAAWSNLTISVDTTGTTSVSTITTLNNEADITSELGSGTPEVAVIFYGKGRGEYYNNIRIKLTAPSNTLLTNQYILDIYQKQISEDAESGYPQYGIIETFNVSFDNTKLDESGESMWIEDVINKYSTTLKCKADVEVCKSGNTALADWSEDFDEFELTDGDNYSYANPKFNLSNGSSGSLFNENGSVNTTVATQLLTNAYAGTLKKLNGQVLNDVLNTEDFYFTIVLDGGYPTDVKTSGINTLVQSRKDCVALVDNGDNAAASTALTARANNHTFNTSYIAMYEPYNKIYDPYTGRDIWITPIFHLANIVPYTDNVGEIWSAAAGFNRATIANIKELRFNPGLSDRDQLYLQQINPIVKFNVGYTVWSQLTSQKRPTALQDLNISRLVLYIKRALSEFCKYYIFEQNDEETWSAISIQINNFLKTIQNRRGLDSYSISVGADEYERKQKKIHCNVTLQPTRVVEKIDLNFYIL